MNTDVGKKKPIRSVDDVLETNNKPDPDDALISLVETMQSVDLNSEDATANETTFKDTSGRNIVYLLTADMLKGAKKSPKTISEKWIELQVKQRLLKQLLLAAKNKLENNTRFHDYAHAVEVLLNANNLMKVEGFSKYEREIIWAAALFHDLSNSEKKEVEGEEGAKFAEEILKKINDFPKDKIIDVKRLIKSINLEAKADDEILINAADEMAALSDLGLIRSMMISGRRGMKVKEALEWELNYIEKRYSRLRLESAKRLIKRGFEAKKKFINNCLNLYTL